MSRRSPRITPFEIRSLMLIASVSLAMAGSAYAQAGATPASADAEIAAAFAKADKNADGQLSREEATLLPAVATNFERVDADKSGTISTDEFAKAMKM